MCEHKGKPQSECEISGPSTGDAKRKLLAFESGLKPEKQQKKL